MFAIAPALILGLIGSIPVAGPVLAAGASAIAAVLGRLLTNKYVLIGLAGLALFIAGDVHGHRAFDAKIAALNAKWQAKVDQAAADFAEARKAREDEVATIIDKTVAEQTADILQHETDLQQQVTDYEKQLLASKSGAACRLGDDDIRVLAPRSRKPGAKPIAR